MQYFCVSKCNFRGSCQINCLIICQLQSMPESLESFCFIPGIHKSYAKNLFQGRSREFQLHPWNTFSTQHQWQVGLGNLFLRCRIEIQLDLFKIKVPFTSPSALHETNTVAILQPLNLDLSTTYVAIKFTLIMEKIQKLWENIHL